LLSASRADCRLNFFGTGAADISVLFSANDAYMRDLHLIMPPDCVVSEQVEQNRLVLKLMRVLKAGSKPSGKIQFKRYYSSSSVR
jgi:isochorismate hydrolase